MEIDTKEIELYKQDMAKAEKYSFDLVIGSKEDYEAAMTEGKSYKDILEKITTRKEEITKPLNSALKSVRDLFKPLETAGENALKTIKTKMLAFITEENRKAEEAKRKLAERVEKGTMKAETAVKKIEAIRNPETTVKTEEAKTVTKTVKKYRVTDKAKIPLEFMEADMVKIKASFRAGKPVEGVEEYEEKEISLY